MKDSPSSHNFLLGYLYTGVLAAVSITVKGKLSISAGGGGLAAGVGRSSRTGRFDGAVGFARGGGFFGADGHAVVVETDFLSAGAYGAGSQDLNNIRMEKRFYYIRSNCMFERN